MDVKLNCPRCGEALSADEKQGSGIVECPTCKYEVNVAATLTANQPASAVRSPPASQPSPQPRPPQLRESAIAASLIVFAILDFLAAGVGMVLTSSHLSGERQFGWLLVFAGFGGGIVLLAFAKIVQCLHEAVYRLKSIQSQLEK